MKTYYPPNFKKISEDAEKQIRYHTAIKNLAKEAQKETNSAIQKLQFKKKAESADIEIKYYKEILMQAKRGAAGKGVKEKRLK